MDINELINNLRFPSWHDLEDPDATLLTDAADALSTLQAENAEMQKRLNESSEFLCYMTGGLLSKTNYTAQEMISAAEDYQQKGCGECDLRVENIRWGQVASEQDKAVERLQEENEKLRNSRDRWRKCAEEFSAGVNQKDDEHERLQAENEKLRAELERVKEERDAVVESIPHECKTCVYHTVFFNGCTLDHDCTNPDGGCSNNYDRWRWRGPRKEE